MKIRLLLALGLLTFCCVSLLQAADPPWKRLNLLRPRIESDPNKDFAVDEPNGPWMIMAITFSGERAAEQARELVHELRHKHKLPAYTHVQTFDFSQPVEGLHVDKYGNPKRMRHARPYRVDEVAVLVGDYPAVNDPKAQKDLEKIKHIHPEMFQSAQSIAQREDLNAARQFAHHLAEKLGAAKPEQGPMGRAFITTNPLLPTEFFVSRGVDRFVEQMNKGVRHSLMNCPGKYSVQVATFEGQVILDQRRIQKIQQGIDDVDSGLAEAAEKAHTLCAALREAGYEAYEFHDRNASIVTIGSFDTLGTPRQDGKIEINPAIHDLMQRFTAKELPEHIVSQVDQNVIGRQPKKFAGISLDLQPMPVVVPKRSFASAFGR